MRCMGTPPPWNVISAMESGDPIAFTAESDDRVDRPINESPSYGSNPSDSLPCTTFGQLENLSYISRAADRCTWDGQECVFKRIEFDADFSGIEGEIRTHEKLIQIMKSAGAVDLNAEMTRRFLLVPVLAVVIGHSKPRKPNTVAGLLMPYAGKDLEILVRECEASVSPPS